MKAKGLGRGLDALLGGDEPPREALATVETLSIRPGRYQPRTRMDEQSLAELAQSIRSQGLLQPLVVRPIGRTQLVLARFFGAAGVCVAYVLIVYFAALAITDWAGGWTPDRILAPGLELAVGVVVVAALSTLGSVFLTSTANGIGVLMVFGAGLVGGLLGQIGEAIDSERLNRISEIASWVVPFEALYQDGLNRLTSDTYGFTRFALQLGPFGGSKPASGWLLPWTGTYLLLVGALAAFAFSRRDL